MTLPDERIVAAIFELLDQRAAGSTLCPSEAARALAGEEPWRALMPDVRRVAAKLAAAGALRVTAQGAEVDALQAHGPIRLGRPADRAHAAPGDASRDRSA